MTSGTSARSSGLLVEGPPKSARYRRKRSLIQGAREAWRCRGMVRALAERDLRARYKQALLGFTWSLITPVALMIVFTLFFSRVVKVATGGIPYPLFSYTALVPWGLFTSGVTAAVGSLLSNTALLKRLYTPRELYPLAALVVAGVDTLVSVLPLLLLFVIYGYAPRATSAWVPLLLLIQLMFTVGVMLIVSIVVVYLRDLRHALALILQLALFATPVAYGLELVPKAWLRLYSFLNPLGPVIDGYRRTVLRGQAPQFSLVIPAAITSFATLVFGYWLFKRLESGVVDVA